MNKILIFSIIALTLVVCSVFVVTNPNIVEDYPSHYGDGEVFAPKKGNFDFGTFSIHCANADNFTSRPITKGYTQFVDDTGEITINVIELDKMINYKKWKITSFLNNELKKPSWTVDGILIHQIDFTSGKPLYSAYQKNSTTNTIVYLSTPNEQETADIMNSFKFKEE